MHDLVSEILIGKIVNNITLLIHPPPNIAQRFSTIGIIAGLFIASLSLESIFVVC